MTIKTIHHTNLVETYSFQEVKIHLLFFFVRLDLGYIAYDNLELVTFLIVGAGESVESLM